MTERGGTGHDLRPARHMNRELENGVPARICKARGFHRSLLNPALEFTPRRHADFQPAVARWSQRRFVAPTAAQVAAWPAIRAHRLGKTLTALLAAIAFGPCKLGLR